MAKKPTYEEVSNTFRDKGFKLISDSYIGAHHLLDYICSSPEHGTQKISYSNLKKGRGCRKCFGESTRLSYDTVKQTFDDAGYTLIDSEYINNSTKIKYQCSNSSHGVNSMTYGNFQRGQRCPKCSKENTANKLKHQIEDIEKVFKDRGYTLIDTEYINSKLPLRFACDKHGEQTIFLFNLINGSGCKQCASESTKDKLKTSYETVRDNFASRGYVLVSKEYVNFGENITFICPSHGLQEISYGSLMSGRGCNLCGYDKTKSTNHWHWMGGITEVSRYLRNNIAQWTSNALAKENYICKITGVRNGTKVVHHQYSFNKIVKETLDQLNLPVHQTIGEYTEEELKLLTETFLVNNAKHPYAVLSVEVHRLYHSIYGTDNNEQQFQEFKLRYNSGEFTEQLNIPA